VLAYYGLKVLRKSPRLGLQQLCRKMNVNQRMLTEDDVGFMIAPRINAASRMGKPTDAFRLLTVNDSSEADMLARHLHKINNQRKGIVSGMVKEVRKRLGAQETISPVIVMGNPEWKPALVGLVANSIVEEHERPVFLWGRDGDDVIKGSCRAPEGINVVDLMAAASEFFIDYGGHSASGGFSVAHESVHFFEEGLQKAFLSLKKKPVKKSIVIDKQLSLDDISEETYRAIEQLAPFGVGNAKPIFLFKSITVDAVKLFGKEGNHLRLEFKKKNGSTISAIGFFTTPESFKKRIAEGESIDLVASIEKSTFRNMPGLRLRIVDVL